MRRALLIVGVFAALFLFGCGGEEPSADYAETYWPSQDKTYWLMEGRWEDLSGKSNGGPLAVETYVAGTTYDGAGNAVKIWLSSELDGKYFFRIVGDEVWANWYETDPTKPYYRWLILPPQDGQAWQDDRYCVNTSGPYAVGVPYGTFDNVYRVRYDYVGEPGHYETWWYAPGIGCIKYEHLIPGDKHELLELVSFQYGG